MFQLITEKLRRLSRQSGVSYNNLIYGRSYNPPNWTGNCIEETWAGGHYIITVLICMDNGNPCDYVPHIRGRGGGKVGEEKLNVENFNIASGSASYTIRRRRDFATNGLFWGFAESPASAAINLSDKTEKLWQFLFIVHFVQVVGNYPDY